MRHSHVGPEAATLYHDLMLQQEPGSAGNAAASIDKPVTETLGSRRTDAAGRRHVNTGERVHATRRRFLSAGLKDDAHASSVGGANFVRETFHAVG
jgi:hypothetical protein